MSGLVCSDAVAKAHAPLVQRAAAIVGAIGGASGSVSEVLLRGTREAAAPGRVRSVTLEHTGRNMLSRDGAPGRFTLAYSDAASDTALAALLAAVAQPGAPIAADPESLSILALAERLAASEIPVLINGPTGTGKEGHCRAGPFIAVNCAAMPETMLEALLFGHQKGAFTGASAAAEGFFRAADGGTLLLDEIAEMPLQLQAKLLRTLQEGEVVPIGATQPIKIDVRVIACANRDLPTEVTEGRFRPDLFYRLNVFPLGLRPLRERADDIAPLAFAMLLRHTPQGRGIPWLSEAALAMLRLHGWPGNVRELENVMRRALLLADGAAQIETAHISFDSPARLIGAAPEGEITAIRRLSNIVQLSEERAIMEALDSCSGNRIAAARQLGISERTLRYRLASFREAGLALAAGAAR
jgi:two-component system, response regulator FlrC